MGRVQLVQPDQVGLAQIAHAVGLAWVKPNPTELLSLTPLSLRSISRARAPGDHVAVAIAASPRPPPSFPAAGEMVMWASPSGYPILGSPVQLVGGPHQRKAQDQQDPKAQQAKGADGHRHRPN